LKVLLFISRYGVSSILVFYLFLLVLTSRRSKRTAIIGYTMNFHLERGMGRNRKRTPAANFSPQSLSREKELHLTGNDIDDLHRIRMEFIFPGKHDAKRDFTAVMKPCGTTRYPAVKVNVGCLLNCYISPLLRHTSRSSHRTRCLLFISIVPSHASLRSLLCIHTQP